MTKELDNATETVEDPKADSEKEAAAPEKKSPETVDEWKAENERLGKLLEARNKEEAARRKKLEALELKEQERQEASKTELEKAIERANKAEQRANELRLKDMRRDAAESAGLPKALADRLKGETLEELEADAALILASLPVKTAPKLDPTNPGGLQTGETEAEKRKRLLI